MEQKRKAERDRWEEVVSLQFKRAKNSGRGGEDDKIATSMNKLKGISCGANS